MNNWGRDQYQNIMVMGHQIMNSMQPLLGQNHHQPLLRPQFLLPEISIPINPTPPVSAPVIKPPLIGPILPDNFSSVDMAMSDEENESSKGEEKDEEKKKEREGRRDKDGRDNRDRDRGQGMRRDRFHRNDRNDRNDRGRDRNDRNRDRDRRRSKWESIDDADQNENIQGEGNRRALLPPPIPGGPMGFGGPMGSNSLLGPGPGMGSGVGHEMGHGGLGMGQEMGPGGPGVSQGLGSRAPGMGTGSGGPMGSGGPGIGGGMMMPGMIQQYEMQIMPGNNVGNMMQRMNMPNMMTNMMDPNMMMMNPNMMMPNQPIYVTNAELLPPVPGASMPNRREKPVGCRTIFVGGVPNGIPEQTIKEIFQSFGVISDIKIHRQGVCHVRFENHESVEASFFISGYRFKLPDQTENEATTLLVDYALNRDDQNEYERNKRHRAKTPPRIEPFSQTTLAAVIEKIKSDEQFAQAAPTLLYWLERGECNKRNANTFYSLIQASNNQVRRLFNEKMILDEEYQNMKSALREKFGKVVEQFEQVAKILTVAKHQRVSDHFTKQQRRNIEMWLKMTEEVENIKEDFNSAFDEEENEKAGREVVSLEKFEKLRMEHENLMYELEGYKNEAYLAKDEAERKFEKFKAHYIAQQALQNKQGQHFPPLPSPPVSNMMVVPPLPPPSTKPPPPTPDDDMSTTPGPFVPPTEARLISILTAFLMVHPLGASVDYLVSYVRSMIPQTSQTTVEQVLKKYTDVFVHKASGIGANIDIRWSFIAFDSIKSEQHG